MVWAVVALLVIAFVGLPAAGWWFSRRPVPPDSRRAMRHSEVDRWLTAEYGLDWQQRARVQRAVARGRPVGEPALDGAAQELARRVLSGKSRLVVLTRALGAYNMVLGCVLAAIGIGSLVRGHWVGVFALAAGANFGLLAFGQLVFAPRQRRRNAALLLGPGRASGPSSPSSQKPDASHEAG